MKITTNNDYYLLKYYYRFNQPLSSGVEGIIKLHKHSKQVDSTLFMDITEDDGYTNVNVTEVLPVPLINKMVIVSGIEGMSVSLDLLTSEELNTEINSMRNLQMIW